MNRSPIEWKLRAIMILLGISAVDLAGTAGITPQAINYALARADRLRPRTREKLIEALRKNITVERFENGEGSEGRESGT